MFSSVRTVTSVAVAITLVGCAVVPNSQVMTREIAAAVQPVDVKVGLKQPELYAQFEPSTAGAAAAAGCGAVPGLGILLAAACGGALGAVDATVNAERAKVAEETIRPLKDEIVDVKVDQLITEATSKALKSVPGMQVASLALTTQVENKAYEEVFQASTANGVMFVNIDYHISKDFSTLEVTARGLLYPRSTAARTAAGLPATAPTNEPLLAPKNAAYRASVAYQLQLPLKGATPQAYVDAWKANGASLLRNGLATGSNEVARLIADELQRVPSANAPAPAQVDVAPGIKGSLMAERDGGRVLRDADGSIHFVVTAPTAATNTAAASTASTAAAQ
ncbi:MAG: hypothetical protein U1F53_22510 [Burkholderiaceae bacterium]